ncbi:hypothetical protein AAG570_011091 [Ranatra chinensis]|uniref:C-type lectin domain-containing protein n=1 Tax=Ranatra chinensis TaxID=642074 RepID=A0ABD0Z7X0_9HEMI
MGNRRYWCPKRFIRSGNSCYFLSAGMATWHDAHFKCRDMGGGSELAVFDKKWEDRNMRVMLNRNEATHLERWIGGIYDWAQDVWVWGASGRQLQYQGFSGRKPGDDYRWKCIIMDPRMLYRYIG